MLYTLIIIGIAFAAGYFAYKIANHDRGTAGGE